MQPNAFLRMAAYVAILAVAFFSCALCFNFVQPYVGIGLTFATIVFGPYLIYRDVQKHRALFGLPPTKKPSPKRKGSALRTVLFFLLGIWVFSSCTRIDTQFDGVLVTNYGQNPDTDYKDVKGTVWDWMWGTYVIQIPAWEQRGNLEENTVTCKDGGTFTIKPTYTYQRKPGQSRFIAINYRRMGESGEDLMNNIENEILNPRMLEVYRDVARGFMTDSLLYHQSLYDSLVTKALDAKFGEAYCSLKTISSNLVPPANMQARIDERNAMRQETEKMWNQVQREKATLEVMRLKGEQNKLVGQTITTEIIRMRELDYKFKELELREKVAWWWRETGCPMPQVVTADNAFYGMVAPPFKAAEK